MKLSIILMTYNQEQYIRTCLDSIFMQEHAGETELIVADDCSTDNTLSIIREYSNRSSFPFVFLPNEKNLGFVKNYQRAFAACNGDYIAVMEGDDYWTNPGRLVAHIAFLEQHRECVMSMNRYISFDQNAGAYSVTAWNSPEDYQYITTQQMASGNRLGNLSACVFRKSEIDKIRPDLYELVVSDWMIGMVLGQYGLLAILKEPMSVYRVHGGGQWSKMTKQEQTDSLIRIIDQYNQYLGYKYDKEFSAYKNKLVQPAGNHYALSDFFPPIVIYAIKLLIPPALRRRIRER